ncbi:MAG: DUF3306 domain-containing protein [Burkholderiaceae bacterium]|nr:DUF3306 domain-containing protein [Burkholderiaceae bacterium]
MAADSSDGDGGFLSRWSRRKTLVRQGAPVAEPVPAAVPPGPVAVAAPVAPATEPAPPAEPAPAAPPPPTLDDVAALAPGAEVRRFVAPGVDPQVKNAALKKLFADPHFNVMDGMDVYIDDYGKPDPLPASWLKQMAQSQFLRLFDEEEDKQPVPPPPSEAAPDENADLRLQPHDDAGRPGAEPSAEPDPGRQP